MKEIEAYINQNIRAISNEARQMLQPSLHYAMPVPMILEPAVGFVPLPVEAAPVSLRVVEKPQPAPVDVESDERTLSQADVELIKRQCVAHGEVERLRVIHAYEQLLAGLRLLAGESAKARRLEAELQQNLLRELYETLN